MINDRITFYKMSDTKYSKKFPLYRELGILDERSELF